MMKLSHEFVKSVPQKLEEAVIYVSIEYRTVIHNCCCGCGNKVITPLSPTSWSLTFDGKSVSLYPSVGNWGLKCQSHYWIRNNEVQWAPKWSQSEIERGRRTEELNKKAYYKNGKWGTFKSFFKKKK